jgi:hypothetical protein
VPPLGHCDGHDLPGPIDKGIPGVTAVINDIVARFEESVREPVDVRDNGDIGGSHLSRRQMQSGLIDDRDSMGSQVLSARASVTLGPSADDVLPVYARFIREPNERIMK